MWLTLWLTFNLRCQFCAKPFAHTTNRHLHENTCNKNPNRIIKSPVDHDKQDATQFGGGGVDETDGLLIEIESALHRTIVAFRQTFIPTSTNLLHRLKSSLTKKVNAALKTLDDMSRKYFISLKVVFFKATNPGIITDPPPVFNTEPFILLPATDLNEQLEVAYTNLMQQIDSYEKEGSGWVLHHIKALDLNTVLYDPLNAYRLAQDKEVDNDNNVVKDGRSMEVEDNYYMISDVQDE